MGILFFPWFVINLLYFVLLYLHFLISFPVSVHALLKLKFVSVFCYFNVWDITILWSPQSFLLYLLVLYVYFYLVLLVSRRITFNTLVKGLLNSGSLRYILMIYIIYLYPDILHIIYPDYYGLGWPPNQVTIILIKGRDQKFRKQIQKNRTC
jgi:hypothetical protein